MTGTAANALALSQIVPSYGAIYCHDAAHIMVDEAGAPEFFAGGAKLIGFLSLDGKSPLCKYKRPCITPAKWVCTMSCRAP